MTLVDKSRFRPTPNLRPRRRRIMASVAMTDQHGQTHAIVVENVSHNGIKAQVASGPPPVGTTVTITLPDGSALWGVVRWTSAASCGIEVELPAAG